MSGTACSNNANGYAAAGLRSNGYHDEESKRDKWCCFQIPLHYPRFKKSDYEAMPEWRLDCLLREYGLPISGDVDQKRKFAMGAFLWPSDDRKLLLIKYVNCDHHFLQTIHIMLKLISTLVDKHEAVALS